MSSEGNITVIESFSADDTHALGVALRQENGIALNVYPAFLPDNHPLSSVKGAYNAIYVTGNIVDDIMFYGRCTFPELYSAAC